MTVTYATAEEPPCIVPDHQNKGQTTSPRDPRDPRILVTVDDRVKEILRSTWSDDFGVLYELGTDIYSEIFKIDPSVKKLFTALDGYDLEHDPAALRQCSGFSKQALRFVQTISMTIHNSSHLHTIEEYLRDIGRRHVQYKHRGFEPGHWHVFETAMCRVMEARAAKTATLNDEDRLLLAKAYTQLSRHIVALMTIGYREEEKKQDT